MADNAYTYAKQWLNDLHHTHPTQIEEIESILSTMRQELEESNEPPPPSMGTPPDTWAPS
jgi:hypothetical protein